MPRRKGKRRGQAEVIGGLIVLTLLFMLAIPMILNSYQSVQQSLTLERQKLAEQVTAGNEKLSVGPVPLTNESVAYGIYPGVWINNTGTISVTLKYLYLLNQSTDSIYAIIDLTTARPSNNPLITLFRLNYQLDLVGVEPPAGEPVVLDPGDTLLIAFDAASLGPSLDTLIALVETSSGNIYPKFGVGTAQSLAGLETGGGNATIPREAIWRGIFAPRSGFYLRGYDELMKYGYIDVWRPPLRLYSSYYSSWWGCTSSPSTFDYRRSFIYEDPDYPGLYMLNITAGETFCIATSAGLIRVSSGSEVVIKGFIGTYTFDGGNYFSGYAFEVWVNGVLRARGTTPYYPTVTSYERADFDGNGVDEIVFYSYRNGPNLPTLNIDADDNGDDDADSLVWSYVVTRDISNSDFVQITAKINYYWTKILVSCPSQYRQLKIFSLVVWEYNNNTGTWDIYQYKNFGYTNEKPVQFQVSATFPLNRSHTYRVGIMFFDPYMDFDYAYYCYEEFTYTVEHLMVEYGVVNPFFKESPPVYIVAIPDPALINNIGEQDYLNAHNLTDIDTAKVDAQRELLNKILAELNYAGVSGYTIISDSQTLNDLLFGDIPPRYAIVIYLQGDTPISTVTGGAVTDYTLENYIDDNHWVFMQVSGEPLWGSLPTFYNAYARVSANTPPLGTSITDAGIKARLEFTAYYLSFNLPYNYTVYFTTATAYSDYVIWNATFYSNDTVTPEQLGLVAFLVNGGGGAVIVNGIHVDWDLTGDGARPETVAQQAVYSSLYAWQVIRG